jgi:YgiT-type zinc finger domain-containing protein
MEGASTTFTVAKNGMLYVMEDVPCFECSVCEHITFEQQVAKELERCSSGKFYPQRYRMAFVFKWGEPMVVMPTKPLEVSLENRYLELSIVGTSR